MISKFREFKSVKPSSISIFSILCVFVLISCTPSTVSAVPENVQVTNITENETITGLITQSKTFNQCDSSSVFRTEIQFSDSTAQTNQQQLVLGAAVTGGGDVAGAVKLEIQGSVEKHFSETSQQGQAHVESAAIEVPAYTWQEYTITWEETRRNGTVEYVENGQTKQVEYSYRTGLQLVSTIGKDIQCPETSSNSPTENISTPEINSSQFHEPVISSIEIQPSIRCDGQKYDVTIHFFDQDGDAYLIYWELLNSKKQTSFSSEVREFNIDSSTQVNGAIFHDFVKWNTLGDEVKIQVVIEDRTGLKGSEIFNFICIN